MHRKRIFFVSLILLVISLRTPVLSQPTWTMDPFGKEKKPVEYEEKKLGSEKTADKKFTTFRRIVQNNVTHYNFYFNANNKLNAVIERAKMAQKDDFSRLLSFYPYSFENTASQKVELDSVIYKATAGILLHDLRSDWVDNLYLLIGKAYFLREELDSAALTFQFINYNLFPRKKNEDDNRIVGANENASGNVLSIANKENRNVMQKVMSKPPSRNDALIWLARTFTDKEEFGDAAGLINILHNDPNLPNRLKNDLEEVTAYWFYAQEHYDSAAVHLEKALSKAEDKQVKARWEFLLGQMYEMTSEYDKASAYYARASKHTVDPVMDIYARLNDAKMFRQNGNTKELQNSIARLLKMAKKDRYESYRDIIYYSTGQLSLQQPDTINGITYYNKSIYYNENKSPYRSKSFLQLANITYIQRDYKSSYAYYDSLKADIATLDAQPYDIADRTRILKEVVDKIMIIEREDSLQMIAAMEPDAREAFLKKLLKKYRKEQGLKEDDSFTGNTLITFNDKKNEPLDMFQSSNSSKGEWYFYNTGLKSRGFNEFKSKWGKRLNVDNWRRKTATDAIVNRNSGGLDPLINPDSLKSPGVALPPVNLTYDALTLDLPLTPQKIDSSNILIASSMLSLAKLFQFELQDHYQAIKTYDEYLRRFSGMPADEAYLGMYYSYNKLGNTERAAYYKNLLATKYAGSVAANTLLNPALVQPGKNNPEVAKRYEAIYEMFIEGKFSEASDEKKKADSLYGNNYWTPQLLYIEAIHFIKDREDTTAISILKNISTLYPESPIRYKAETMISVLRRRSEIESYLSKLDVTRAEEEHIVMGEDKKALPAMAKPAAPEVKAIVPSSQPAIVKDSVIRVAPPVSIGGFTLDTDAPHFVVMILDKVDNVYIGEARNAFIRYNREKFYNQPITINKDALDPEKALLVFSSFEDAAAAMIYYDKIKKAAPSEISWLQPNKYSFIIISESNLQLLKTNKDINAYKALLNTKFGNKF